MDKEKELLIDAMFEIERTQITMTHCKNKGGYHEPFVIEQIVRNNLLKERIKELLEKIKES